MNTARLWTLGSIVLIIALIAGTWFVGISPRLAEAATANSERASVELINGKHTVTLAALKEQFENLDDLNAELETLRVAVPKSDHTADLLRQLDRLAAAAGIAITDITLSPPERFAAPATPPTDTELAGALGSVNPENFLIISVAQTVQGEYSKVMSFIDSLQKGDRTYLVHDVALNSGLPEASAQVEVTFIGQVFVLVDQNAAAPATEDPNAAGEGGTTPGGAAVPQ